MADRTTRILIAEDSALLRCLLAEHLSRQSGYLVVGQAATGREAVTLASQVRPDIVIMSLDLPQMNGAEATERIVSFHPYISVILLTAHENLASIGRAFGACECLAKSSTPEALCRAIDRAHVTPDVGSTADAPSQHLQLAVQRVAMRGGLTDRERAAMEKAVATDLTIHQIAKSLAALSDREVTESSVKHALERVMYKLRIEPRTRTALIKHVLDTGLPK